MAANYHKATLSGAYCGLGPYVRHSFGSPLVVSLGSTTLDVERYWNSGGSGRKRLSRAYSVLNGSLSPEQQSRLKRDVHETTTMTALGILTPRLMAEE
jgi:hypothetical protein